MPIGFEDAAKLIETRFKNGWGTTTELALYDNQAGSPDRNVEQWARLTILEGDSALAGLGGSEKLFRNPGVIIVSIFIKPHLGAKPALALADTAAAIFRDVIADNIIYRAPAIARVGDNSGWYQVNVTIPFQWDGFF
jgi:hypothetical protein